MAYLMLAAAPYTFFTGVVIPSTVSLPVVVAVSTTCAVATVAGVLCRWWPALMPKVTWVVAPCVAAVLISGTNLATSDASTAGQLFNLWPVLYAANFLNRRAVYLTLAFVYAGEAIVVFTLLPPGLATADFASMSLAMTMISVVVVPLRARADHLRHKLEVQALADPLTGLANRRSFDTSLTGTIEWAGETGRPIAVLIVDVDHFKSVNDTYGHAVGDRALQSVAAALTAVAGPGDVAARFGGDEFVLLVRTDREGALAAATALRAALTRTGAGLPCGPLGVTTGIGLLPGHARTGTELMAAADQALYRAKSSGRGRDAVYTDLELENILT